MLYALQRACQVQGKGVRRAVCSSVTPAWPRPTVDELSARVPYHLERAVYPGQYRRPQNRAEVDERLATLLPSAAPEQHPPAQAASNHSNRRWAGRYFLARTSGRPLLPAFQAYPLVRNRTAPAQWLCCGL